MGWRFDSMILAFIVVLLCGLALSVEPSDPERYPLRLRRAAPSERWLEIISQYAKERIDAERVGRPDYMPKPFPVSLPIGAENGKAAENLPILILPVPVRVPSEGCNVNNHVQSVVTTNTETTLNKLSEETPSPPHTQPRPFGFGFQNQQTGQQYQGASKFENNQQTGQQYQVSSKFEYNKSQNQEQNNVQTVDKSGSLDKLVQRFNEEVSTEQPFVNKPVSTSGSNVGFGSVTTKTEYHKPIGVDVQELNVPQKPTFEYRPFPQFSFGTKSPVVQNQYQFSQVTKPTVQNQFQFKQETKKETAQSQFQFRPQPQKTVSGQSQFQFNQVPQKTVPAQTSFQFNQPQKTAPVKAAPVFNQFQFNKPAPVQSSFQFNQVQKVAPVQSSFQLNQVQQKVAPVQSSFQLNQVQQKVAPVQSSFQLNQVQKVAPVQSSFQLNQVQQKVAPVQSSFQFNQVQQKVEPVQSSFQLNQVQQKVEPVQSSFQLNQVQQKIAPVQNVVVTQRTPETPKPLQIEPLKQFEFREQVPVVPKPVEIKPQFQQQVQTQAINYNPQLINSFVQNFETPTLDESVSSEYLLEQFRKQQPQAPHLPPAVIDDREVFPADEVAPYAPANGPFEYQSQEFNKASLSKPRWPKSLYIQAFLTVPRADYTEPYAMWYDGETGASRVELHGGATVAYKTPLPGGQFQRIEMRIDNSDDVSVRRCNVAPPQTLRPAEVQAPGLPDLEQFEFSGFVKVKGQDTEKWTNIVKTAPSVGGGANGESLKYTHTVLLTRSGDYARPLEYSVTVDSTVLGPLCDGYTHTYTEVVEKPHKPDIFTLNADSACTEKWAADPAQLDQLATLEPLREFTLPTRDPRYDDAFIWFKKTFERVYIDDKEEAIRKNLLVQTTRFCNSGNREGATFELGVNFLADRLESELDVLLGVEAEDENIPAENFPHTKAEIEKDDKELSDAFDWRDEGAVTPARYQGSCSSCWAFAVTAAVEGALFIKTKSLVPLAEQHLVDCGHTHGTHGCQGTWPSFAYDYIQDKGIPSLAEYGMHKEKVETCRQVAPVTHISAHVNVTKNSVPALKVAIRKHAPTVVIIDAKAKSFIYYKKGVLQDKRCGKSKMPLNHAVTAVGWGTKEGRPHFIVKNSWSAAWGESGFARLEGPTNTCGVLSLPSYPRLEKEDVDRLPGGGSA